jgi:hypothetical protein
MSTGTALVFNLDARWGMGGQGQDPAALPPGYDPVPTVQEGEWAQRPVWTAAVNIARTGIRSPERPASSQSLYRILYAGQHNKE